MFGFSSQETFRDWSKMGGEQMKVSWEEKEKKERESYILDKEERIEINNKLETAKIGRKAIWKKYF